MGGVGLGGVGLNWRSRLEGDGCEPNRTWSGMSLASGTTGSAVTVSESNCPRAVVMKVATLLVACDGRRATPGSRSVLFERERTIGGPLCRLGWSTAKPATGGEECASIGRREAACGPWNGSRVSILPLVSQVDLRCGLGSRVCPVCPDSSPSPLAPAGKLRKEGRLLDTAFAGRFPAALALIPVSLVCGDEELCPDICDVVGNDRLEDRFDMVT